MDQKGVLFPGRAQEVKARRRREVRLPGKEEYQKVLSSISFPEVIYQKERPAQRITGFSPPSFRQQRSHP